MAKEYCTHINDLDQLEEVLDILNESLPDPVRDYGINTEGHG